MGFAIEWTAVVDGEPFTVFSRSSEPDGSSIIWQAFVHDSDHEFVRHYIALQLDCDENDSWRGVEHVFVAHLCDLAVLGGQSVLVCDRNDNLAAGRPEDAAIHPLDAHGGTCEMPVRTNFVDHIEVDARPSGVVIDVRFPGYAPVRFEARIDDPSGDGECLVLHAGTGIVQWDDGDAENGPHLQTIYPRETIEWLADAETGLILDGQFMYDQDTVHWNSAFGPFDVPTRGEYVEDHWTPHEI